MRVHGNAQLPKSVSRTKQCSCQDFILDDPRDLQYLMAQSSGKLMHWIMHLRWFTDAFAQLGFEPSWRGLASLPANFGQTRGGSSL